MAVTKKRVEELEKEGFCQEGMCHCVYLKNAKAEPDKCCGNCKWWGIDRFPENLGCRLPDTGDGFSLCGKAGFVHLLTRDEWQDEPMSVIDVEGYSADLITRKDHYCSAWETK